MTVTKKFSFTHLDFAENSNIISKLLLEKSNEFSIIGFSGMVTETFTGSGINPGQVIISVGNGDNNYKYSLNNSIDLTVSNGSMQCFDDSIVETNNAMNINAYFQVLDEGKAGLDLNAGSVDLYLIISDVE